MLVRRPALGGAGEVREAASLATQLPDLRREFVSNYQVVSPTSAESTSSAENFNEALSYFDCIAAALDDSLTGPLDRPSGPVFAPAYERFSSVLSAFGYKPGSKFLVDRNFCLSMLDQLQTRGRNRGPQTRAVGDVSTAAKDQSITPGRSSWKSMLPAFFPRGVAAGAGMPQMAGLEQCTSATRALNLLSNRVQRTLLYGETPDVDALAAALVSGRIAFARLAVRWCKDERLCGEAADALAYYDALCALLRDGLRCDYAGLKDTYIDGFQRLLDNIVEALGTTALGRGTRKDLAMLSDFALWEREIRFNMTGSLWDEHPVDMVGGWSLVESDSASLLSNTRITSFNYDEGGGTSRARWPSATLAPGRIKDLMRLRDNFSDRAAVTLLEGGG